MGLDQKVAAHLLIGARYVLFNAGGCLNLEPALLKFKPTPARTEKSVQLSQIQPLALSREPPTSCTSLFWLDQECQNKPLRFQSEGNRKSNRILAVITFDTKLGSKIWSLVIHIT